MSEILSNLIEIKGQLDELEKTKLLLINKIDETFSQLNVDTMEKMTFEELFNIYNISKSFLKSNNLIKENFLEIFRKKRNELYPEFNRAFRYKQLNALNLPDKITNGIDNMLARYKVNDFVYKDSSIARPYKEYFEQMYEIGIFTKVYKLEYENEFDGEKDRTLITEDELKNHNCVWKMLKQLKTIEKIPKNSQEIKDLEQKIDELEEQGYGYIYVGDSEISSLEEFTQFYDKEILYKLIAEEDTSLLKYDI